MIKETSNSPKRAAADQGERSNTAMLGKSTRIEGSDVKQKIETFGFKIIGTPRAVSSFLGDPNTLKLLNDGTIERFAYRPITAEGVNISQNSNVVIQQTKYGPEIHLRDENESPKNEEEDDNADSASQHNVLEFSGLFGLPQEFSDFTGREEALKQLSENQGPLVITDRYQSVDDEAHTNESVKKASTQHIAGTGGIGKSQLANHFARGEYKLGRYQWVVWLRVGNGIDHQSTGLLDTQWNELGLELGINTQVYHGKTLVKLIYQKLSALGSGLVIFDDAMDLMSIKSYLPSAFNHTSMDVIFTSCNASIWQGFTQVVLSVFKPAEALAYIKRRLNNKGVECEESGIKRLAKILGYYPLALTQAVSYIVNNDETLDEYCDAFESTKEEKKARLGGDKLLEDDYHQETILITLEMSLKKIDSQDAKTLLDVVAYLAPEAPIDKGLLQYWVEGKAGLNRAIMALKRYSLVEASDSRAHVKVHQMVQSVIQLTHSSDQVREWRIEVASKVGQFFVEDLPVLAKESRQRVILPHLEHLIDQLGQCAEGDKQSELACAEMLLDAGNVHFGLGNAKAAHSLYQRCLVIEKVHYGPAHVVVARTLGNLAGAVRALGEYHEAKALYEQALPILEAYYGSDHVEVAKTLGNLATAVGALGDHVEAKRLHERALPILEAYYGSDHVEVAKALGNLATVVGALGDYQEKKRLFERALPIVEAHLKSIVNLQTQQPLRTSCLRQGVVRFTQLNLARMNANIKMMKQAMPIKMLIWRLMKIQRLMQQLPNLEGNHGKTS